MNRKKKRQPIRCFTFSPEMIQVTQEAMKLFAHYLGKTECQLEKVAFAKETMQQVESKLAAMHTSVGAMCLTSFDWNEKMVIAAAIQLYMAEPRTISVPHQREKELRRCQRIMRFALDPGVSHDKRVGQDAGSKINRRRPV